VGIDVGGSSIKCALVDLITGAFASERFSAPTPRRVHRIPARRADDRGIEHSRRSCRGLGFSERDTRGTVLTAANLNKAWIGQPLAALAGAHLRRPVIAINDADAAGWPNCAMAPPAMWRAPCCC